jgi:hypothetical protein
MKKIFFLLTALTLTVSFSPLAANADCLPGAPGCDIPATTEAQCTAVSGTWFNNQCIGATGVTPGTVTQAPPSGAGGVNTQWLEHYADTFIWVVNWLLVPVLIAIAFIVFLWGVYKYFIYGADSDEARKTGRQFVLWGIIGFVIITSVWGLVNIVKTTVIPSGAGSNHPDYPKL